MFNDHNFMLKNETAKELYKVAKEQPIFDYHCHLNPQEIFEDKAYDNIVDLWLAGDHYKWRLMRANGVSERLITGDASNEEKFQAWAETIGRAYGNALFHWSNLELKQVFGIDEVLTGQNWKEIYDELNKQIKDRQLSPRDLIKASNVKFIGTTDNPLDSLEWHAKIAADDTMETIVAPTFRPDQAFVSHADFASFTGKLADLTSIEIKGFDSFIEAMEARIKHFIEHGCKASDISFGEIHYVTFKVEDLDGIFTKAMSGQPLSKEEIEQWHTATFMELCRLYKENNMVTQVHFGARRNNNSPMFERLGSDVGFDSIGDQTDLGYHLNTLLDQLNTSGKMPKMIWYNLNPSYNTILSNALANFQANEEGIKSRNQFGAGWWFADTKLGMIDQMNNYADQGLFANFLGMLTDSRSFLSYQRHDYFRRILCTFVGEWVEEEEVPNDTEALNQLIKDICYNNSYNFFK